MKGEPVCSHGEFSMLMVTVFWMAVVSGVTRQSGNLFPGSLRRHGTSLYRFSSSQGKRIRCAISSSTNNNGGVAEVSESESVRRVHAWPDYKVSALDVSYKAIVLVYSESV